MKKLKRLLAVVIAMAMVVAMGLPAMAAPKDEDPENPGYNKDGTQWNGDTNYDTAWRGTADGAISVQGLQKDDTVKFYKILAYDQNAGTAVADLTATSDVTKGAGGWKVIAPFATGDNAITGTDLKAILSTGITDALAGKIGKNAVETTDPAYSAAYNATAGEDGVATVGTTAAPVEAGLYIAIITSQTAGIVYNPVFVGSDYYKTGTSDNSSTWTVDTDMSYSNEAMAKKSLITVDKTAKDSKTNDTNDSETVAVGDEITFSVKTTIPEFADNYINAVFNVTDVLTSGLKLDKTSIKVYEATIDSTTGEYAKGDEITKSSGTVKTFTIPDANLTDTGYKVVFDTDYLINTLSAAQPIIIEYKATVQDTALTSVNVEDNTVTINYSNNPTDNEGHGTLKDETKHYTFDIDGNLFGTENDTTPWKTVEVVKVGLDKDGKEITVENVTWHEGEQTQPQIGPLAGATFKLYVADTNGSTDLTYNNTTIKGTPYTNGIYTTTPEIVSDATGRLTVKDATTPGIRGLDAGVYYLVEETAPEGYIRYQDAVKIEIKTTMKEVTYTDERDPSITWKVQELQNYSIEINGVKSAEYTFTNAADQNDDTLSDNTDAANHGDNIVGSDTLIGANPEGANAATGKITNTQGVELPSTGGIGTTIFYVVGAILVIGAGVVLITRRRMDA